MNKYRLRIGFPLNSHFLDSKGECSKKLNQHSEVGDADES
jgi:hypothetical protein